MANSFSATDELFASLAVVDQVAALISLPTALSPANLPTTNAISCGVVVLLSGYFESFLKDIVEDFIGELNSLNKPLVSIPYEMRHKHFASGAQALTWASKKDKKSNQTTNSEDLARRLASLANPLNYELAWEAFADTKSNPGPDVVSGMLKGLGIEKAWPEINGLVTEHGQLQTFLGTFIEMRNTCAHTGQHANPPTGQIIYDYTLKFRALAECVDLVMGLKIDEFKALPNCL